MDPQICHINEGHAAFAALERARFHMLDHGIGFRQALLATRPGNLFTTHTPVEAGFDRFPPGLIRQYLGDYVAGLGLDIDEFLALGRVDATASDEPFNMAYLALRICGAANAVSRLHTAVSRGLFASVFPRTPLAEVPVDGVTNAVHVPSWLSPASHRFWLERCGTSCWYGREAVTGCGAAGDGDPSGPAEPAVSHAWKDEDLWSLRCRNRAKLVEAVRNHSAGHHGDPWRSAEERVQPDRLLDPDVLTLGFARRFAGYKRCTLLLRDPDRLARILSDNARPVQLVVAGKAHPSDDEGKAMIRTWAQFMKREDVRQRVSFLVDYDMAVAAQVVQGVDVWVNNPRRPLEASGTSGMKVLANGGLNLSELDGWWDEAYSPDCGWCIGDDLPEGLGGSALDDIEAEQLYRRLERELVPLFYERDACGIPAGWVRMMQNSMERLALEFSADRMVSDYVRRFYLPGAAAFAARTADGSSSAMALLQWMDTVGRLLPGAQVQLVGATDESGRHRFEVRVTANGLEDDFASGRLVVEAYAEPAGILEAASLVHLTLVERDDPDLLFAGEVVSDRPLEHFTPRVRPDHPLAYGRLEMPSLHWLDSLQAE
jgi:starch phosphorylase